MSIGVNAAGFSAHSIRQSRCGRQGERESGIENDALLPQGVFFSRVFCTGYSVLAETFQPQSGIIHRIAATPAGERSAHHMNGKHRTDIQPGLQVRITQKQDQRTGKLTGGIVQDILTKSDYHPHGIKVRLRTGEVGRVQEIVATGHEVAENRKEK